MRRQFTALLAACSALIASSLPALADSGSQGERVSEKGTTLALEPWDGGYSSSESEESALRASAIPVDVSPGGFVDSGGRTIVRVYTDRLQGASATDVTPSVVQPSRFTKESREKIEKDLLMIGNSGRGYSFSFMYDAESDTIQVSGDLPASAIPTEYVGDEVRLISGRGVDRLSRANDSPAHWGGARITNTSATNVVTTCSTGFTIRTTSGLRMVTAGHCGNLGWAWYSGSYTMGVTRARAQFPNWDISLIGDQSYAGKLYMGGASGVQAEVLGAADPIVGATYCLSGAITYENCNKTVKSLFGSLCDTAGCTTNLVVMSGGALPQHGDSGGPMVIKNTGGVSIRGMLVGKSVTNSDVFAEKWSTISDYFGATIYVD